MIVNKHIFLPFFSPFLNLKNIIICTAIQMIDGNMFLLSQQEFFNSVNLHQIPPSNRKKIFEKILCAPHVFRANLIFELFQDFLSGLLKSNTI